MSNFYRRESKTVGFLWLDAHGDINTPESSPSGNVHGMPLASLVGYGAPELVDLAHKDTDLDRIRDDREVAALLGA